MTAISALSKYFEILEGKTTPNYLKARAFGIDVDLSGPTDYLWEKHDEVLKQFRGTEKFNSGPTDLLDLKLELAKRILSDCDLCERQCHVNRLSGEKGFCGVGESRIASKFIHWGEEPELIPSYTIFFNRCSFRCVFCQNWDISQMDAGSYIPPSSLSQDIAAKVGAVRNVNWVGGEPTPNLPYILEVLKECDASLPQVWNSNMYMSIDAMKLLDGIVDLYLSDFKYGSDECAKRLSSAGNYWDIVSRNHKIANAQCEMIIRHLILPNHVECCSKPILKWIAENLDNSTIRVNVMDQYRPEYKARGFKDLSRRITSKELTTAWQYAENLGLDLV